MTAADELVHVLLGELEDLSHLRDREEAILLRWCGLSGRGARDQGHLKIGGKACGAPRPLREDGNRQRVRER